MKTVVVGASSGLGRCVAVGLGQRGAEVALLARRKDRLEDAAKEAGAGSSAIACDVTDPDSVDAAIKEAAEALGGIDGLVYATGIGTLARIADHDVDLWRQTLEANVIGAFSVTKAALPYLTESRGVAAYFSSVSASNTPPWPGLASYAVSKAALDKLVEAWRAEHPGIGFTRVVIGDCAGGEGDAASTFAAHWDQELAAELMPDWVARKYIAGSLVDVDELVKTVEAVLRAGPSVCIQSVTVAPRPPAGTGPATGSTQ